MVDACEWEQTALLRKYVLSRREELEKLAGAEDSAAGPRSISPYVPCAASRIPYIFQAARVTADDVMYDLGCGDGVVLHEAAKRYGCRCVGLDIDAACLELARARAEKLGVGHLCQWLQCDLTCLPTHALGENGAELAAFADSGEVLQPPTVALAFLTSSGLVRMARWLHVEWRTAPQSLRLVTCVESLDSAVDYADPASLFAEANELKWTVCHDHSRWGVFVVPPFGVALDAWRAAGGPPLRLTRADAEATAPAVVPGFLSREEIRLVDGLGRQHVGGAEEAPPSLFDLAEDPAGFHAAAEVALHSLREHRVFYLHGCEALADEASGLPALERALISRVRAHDQWGILTGRDVSVRSLEYHVYSTGGSVLDPEHRDDGSLLTLSVLLSRPEDFSGGAFVTWRGGERVEHGLAQGDGILFASEKRHNVETVTGDRRALVLELWEGPRNRRNRHG